MFVEIRKSDRFLAYDQRSSFNNGCGNCVLAVSCLSRDYCAMARGTSSIRRFFQSVRALINYDFKGFSVLSVSLS